MYISTPNSVHVEHTLAAMSEGKHVVVEKPIAVGASETERLISAAGRRGCFLMEGMWPRFLPSWDTLRQIVDNGYLGELHSLCLDIGEFFSEEDANARLFSPHLGGGVLRDLGVYVVAAASLLMGTPTSCEALGHLTPTGVDAQVSFGLGHAKDRLTSAFTTLRHRTPTELSLAGTHGTVSLGSPWYVARNMTFTPHDGQAVDRTFGVESQFDGFAYEIAEAARCIDNGLTESPHMPLADSYRIQCVLESLMRQVHQGGEKVASVM